MDNLEFIVRSILDQGRLLTLNLYQEIRTESIDQAALLRERIDNIEGLDEENKNMLKRILPPLLLPHIPSQKTVHSSIQMNITLTEQLYKRIGSPRVGDAVEVVIRKKD